MENDTLIRQCLNGSPADAQTTFNQLMFARISTAVEDRKAEIAQTLYQVQPE